MMRHLYGQAGEDRNDENDAALGPAPGPTRAPAAVGDAAGHRASGRTARRTASGGPTAAICAARATRRSTRSTPSNFNKLEVAWRFKTDSLGPRPEFNLQATPLMVNGVLYFTAGTRRAVVALDAHDRRDAVDAQR